MNSVQSVTWGYRIECIYRCVYVFMYTICVCNSICVIVALFIFVMVEVIESMSIVYYMLFAFGQHRHLFRYTVQMSVLVFICRCVCVLCWFCALMNEHGLNGFSKNDPPHNYRRCIGDAFVMKKKNVSTSVVMYSCLTFCMLTFECFVNEAVTNPIYLRCKWMVN